MAIKTEEKRLVMAREKARIKMEKLFFKDRLQESIKERGGAWVAHAHADRAGTIEQKFMPEGMSPYEAANLPLQAKQNLVGKIHLQPEYLETMEERLVGVIECLIEDGVKRFDTFIDATIDYDSMFRVGTKGIEIFLKLKAEYQDLIDLRCGAYNIFGFKNTTPERWDLQKEASKMADFIGSLPERDDLRGHPSHIGFKAHLFQMLHLAVELNKEIHLHLDQGNIPDENGTEMLCEAITYYPKVQAWNRETTPKIWAVHVISPSAYQQDRFKKLLLNLKKSNVGLIICPRAATGMVQNALYQAPIHSSIAQLFEIIHAGIPVRLGVDNIADPIIPNGTPHLHEEIDRAADSLRFYIIQVWSKLAAGLPLDNMDLEFIRRYIEARKEAMHAQYNYFSRQVDELL
ncbi:MAG: hypothetical protein U9Q72_03235 [Patescibacteria group bacterium]|nr:hypothetical protein [Patescibacteria group bacterium]